MVWTQLVYSTIVLVNSNLDLTNSAQFYSGPSPLIRAADVVEVYEGAQERLAAVFQSPAYPLVKWETNAVSYYVEETAGTWVFDEYPTQTFYSATGTALAVWGHSLLTEFSPYPASPPFARPPIQGWRVSRAVLNEAARRLNSVCSNYVATVDPLTFWGSSNFWTAAGSTSGVRPVFYHALETNKLWTLYRATALLDKTGILPATAGGSSATWSTNDAFDPYVAEGAEPAWWTNADLIPGWTGSPTATPTAGTFSGAGAGTVYERALVQGPGVVYLTSIGGTNWQADARSSGSYKTDYSASLTHSASGLVQFPNLAGGVTCSGTLYGVVTGYAIFNGAATQGLYGFSVTGNPWEVTHSGVSTGTAGSAVWLETLPRIMDRYDIGTLTATGAWGTVVEPGGLRQAPASPRATVDVVQEVTWPTNVAYWHFTRCRP